MSEVYLPLADVENLFQKLIVSMLGWDVSTPIQKNNVKIDWATGGRPGWGDPKKNLVFLKVIESDSNYNKEREVVNEWIPSPAELVQRTSYTRQIQVSIVAYGSDSFENVQQIRDSMFYQTFRNVLSQNKIYLIPDIEAPVRAPELFNDCWYERIDMTLHFNELIVREINVTPVESVDITIYEGNEGKEISEINVELGG
jgi:hypothetical protein